MFQSFCNYFLSLENDFIRTLDFVELIVENHETFSNNFAKLLLAVGSEVDVIAKALCDQIAPGAATKNILNCQAIITAKYPIYDAEIDVPRTGHKLKPWANWHPSVSKSPDWWSDYNSVKHDRLQAFQKATQINVLESLAGLLVLNLYLYDGSYHPQPFPELLDGGTPSRMTFDSGLKMPGK